MSDLVFGLDLALVLLAAGVRLKTGMDLNAMRSALAELRQERESLRQVRAQAQVALEYVEVQERELNNDVRDLTAALSEMDQQAARLRAEEPGPRAGPEAGTPEVPGPGGRDPVAEGAGSNRAGGHVADEPGPQVQDPGARGAAARAPEERDLEARGPAAGAREPSAPGASAAEAGTTEASPLEQGPPTQRPGPEAGAGPPNS